MGSRRRGFDSICIRERGFCCVLRNRHAILNQQKALMDLVQSCGNLGVIWGIGRRRASGEEVDSDLGLSISYI
jgi:hypothetical protein